MQKIDSKPTIASGFRDVDLSDFGYSGVEHVGHGHSGSVQLVRDDETGQIFVAKCVTLAALNQHDRVYAQQEVSLLRKLEHPLIVAYHDSFLIERTNILVIIMEYCDGGDLHGLISQKAESGTHFTEDEVMTWFAQIVLALQYIHSQKILHRDLKTSNIFLTKASSMIKLGDFGVSMVLEGTIDAAVTMVGTPYYMSPEVCRNEPYSWKSDVWALGCVLYELCMLKHAFESASLLGLVYKIVSDCYEPIPTDYYSQDLNDLLRNLLAKTAEERPSIDELLANPYVKAYIEKQMPLAAQASSGAVPVPAPGVRSHRDGPAMRAASAPAGGGQGIPTELAQGPNGYLSMPAGAFSSALDSSSLPSATPAELLGATASPFGGALVANPSEVNRALVLTSRVRQRLVKDRVNWISAFACRDESGSGSFPPAVMRSVFASLDLRLSSEEIYEMVDSFSPRGADESGQGIPLSSFEGRLEKVNMSMEVLQLQAWVRNSLEPVGDRFSTLLRIKDGAQSGRLGAADFMAVLRECLPDVPDQQLEVVLLLAEKGTDGQVDYQHFVDAYATTRALHENPPEWPQWLGSPPPPPPPCGQGAPPPPSGQTVIGGPPPPPPPPR